MIHASNTPTLQTADALGTHFTGQNMTTATTPAALTTESVAVQLSELAAKALGKQLNEIDRTSSLRDQGIDSLMFAELVFEVEDAFGVEIANEREVLEGMETIDQIAAYIVAQKAKA